MPALTAFTMAKQIAILLDVVRQGSRPLERLLAVMPTLVADAQEAGGIILATLLRSVSSPVKLEWETDRRTYSGPGFCDAAFLAGSSRRGLFARCVWPGWVRMVLTCWHVYTAARKGFMKCLQNLYSCWHAGNILFIGMAVDKC